MIDIINRILESTSGSAAGKSGDSSSDEIDYSELIDMGEQDRVRFPPIPPWLFVKRSLREIEFDASSEPREVQVKLHFVPKFVLAFGKATMGVGSFRSYGGTIFGYADLEIPSRIRQYSVGPVIHLFEDPDHDHGLYHRVSAITSKEDTECGGLDDHDGIGVGLFRGNSTSQDLGLIKVGAVDRNEVTLQCMRDSRHWNGPGEPLPPAVGGWKMTLFTLFLG